MSDCKKFKDLINLYIDNEIKDADKKELLSHLERCNDCKKDFLIYNKIHKEMNLIKEDNVPENLAENVLNEIKTSKKKNIKISTVVRRISVLAAVFLFAFLFEINYFNHVENIKYINNNEKTPQINTEVVIEEKIQTVDEQQIEKNIVPKKKIIDNLPETDSSKDESLNAENTLSADNKEEEIYPEISSRTISFLEIIINVSEENVDNVKEIFEDNLVTLDEFYKYKDDLINFGAEIIMPEDLTYERYMLVINIKD